MHPYEMQRLLRERHKDELLVLKRGSLYHAINRLLALELIEPKGTGRTGKRPVRTTYGITRTGLVALGEWIHVMLSVPLQETSEFMAALSFLVHLTPKDAISRLTLRIRWLEQNVADLDRSIASLIPRVKRINLVESEYLSAMRKAELAWIKSLVRELHTGQLTWDLKAILREAEAAKRLRLKATKEA
jgi:DNA-binding PadR family transcriptional regulator